MVHTLRLQVATLHDDSTDDRLRLLLSRCWTWVVAWPDCQDSVPTVINYQSTINQLHALVMLWCCDVVIYRVTSCNSHVSLYSDVIMEWCNAYLDATLVCVSSLLFSLYLSIISGRKNPWAISWVRSGSSCQVVWGACVVNQLSCDLHHITINLLKICIQIGHIHPLYLVSCFVFLYNSCTVIHVQPTS